MLADSHASHICSCTNKHKIVDAFEPSRILSRASIRPPVHRSLDFQSHSHFLASPVIMARSNRMEYWDVNGNRYASKQATTLPLLTTYSRFLTSCMKTRSCATLRTSAMRCAFG
jgi:hypothetical protein